MACLIGSPPGYVGYEDAGQLTEAIRRRPYSIVVFDDRKAHPKRLTSSCRSWKGHLSDAKGHQVDFRNTIIIMTSNVGASTLQRGPNLGFSLEQSVGNQTDREHKEMSKKPSWTSWKRQFRPEFLNRVDSIIVFRELSREDIFNIVDIVMNQVNERLTEHSLRVVVTEAGKEWLANEGYDPEFGARPLRRLVQTQVEDRLSDAVLSGRFKPGDTVVIDVEEGNLVLRGQEPALDTAEPDEEAIEAI